MFRHQGPGRSDRHNRLLAAYLATVAGFVNSAAFVLLGEFTSHVTGNVGRFANDLAFQQLSAAFAALTMIAAFFAGALIASGLVESQFAAHTSVAYGGALCFEVALLALFITLSQFDGDAARLHTLQEIVLCMAMGAQNSLVTRLSGAVVRTTHLTGVITDLGIESARWLRYGYSKLSERVHAQIRRAQSPVERPHAAKAWLLVTIAIGFAFGSVGGAFAGARLRAAAMWLPCVAVALSAAYALSTVSRRDDPARGAAQPGDRPR